MNNFLSRAGMVALGGKKTDSLNQLNKQIKFRDGIINLAIGEPQVPPSPYLTKIVIETINNKQHTGYIPISGDAELVSAIQSTLLHEEGIDCKQDEILITSGAKSALGLVLKALIGLGEGVAISTPFYPSFRSAIDIEGGRTIFIKTDKNFKLTLGLLQKKYCRGRLPRIVPKVLIVNSPNNPTGAVYSRDDLREIVCFAKKQRLFIIADEVYKDFYYDTSRPISIASVNGGRNNLLIIRSFSKSFNIPGLRVGYAVGPPEIIQAMKKIAGAEYGCVCSISQRIVLSLLRNYKDYPQKLRETFSQSRQIILDWLYQKGISFISPRGAFYVFPDFSGVIKNKRLENARSLADILLAKRIAVVSGMAFGDYNYHIRIAFCCEPESMKEAIKIMDKVI